MVKVIFIIIVVFGDQRKNLRSNSDKIVSLPTRIKKEYNGNKRLSSPSSGRNS